MSNEAQDKFQKASAVLKIRLEESYQTSFEGLEEPDARKMLMNFLCTDI